MNETSTRRGTIALVAGLALSTAGPAFAAEPPGADPSADGPVDEQSDDVPRGTYVEIDAPDRLVVDPPAQHGGTPHILFLQRCAGGLTLNPGGGGSVANQSSIIGGTLNLPPFPYGDSAWNQVVQETRDIFAPFNITVTDVDPTPMNHDEAVVCGNGSSAGFGGAGGVAPFSCGVINNPITFTFAETIGNNPRVLAEVVAQESAHAWGLDHEYECSDPMTYLSGCGQKSFQDGDYPCGEFQPRTCSCGGSTQNSYQHIMNTFGPAVPDTQSPTAAITYPTDDEVFAPGASFDITVAVNDDVQVTQVTLYVNGEALGGIDYNEPFGPWPVSNIPEGTYEMYIEAQDPANNVTPSSLVTIFVTADGEPPPAPSDGGSDGGNAGTGGTGGDDGSGDGVFDAGGGLDDAGALPPDYGTFGPDPSHSGTCQCRSDGTEDGPAGWAVMLLGLWGLRRLTRRRR